jgi:phospholipid/cholesterol/gamma-HCH transport system substrate-binding protein
MRPVHQIEIKVGLLVLAGLAAATSMVMFADKLRIEHTYTITAYLKDAGGLRFESPVTLSGIAIGKVKAIEFVTPGQQAPGQVRAQVTISQGVVLPADVEARLATSGLFGDSSLALSAPLSRLAAPVPLPTDGSAVLVVKAGVIDQAMDKAGGILNAVDDLLDPTMRADAKRLVHQAADLAEHTAVVAATLAAQQARITAILNNLEALSEELTTTTRTINQRLDPLLAKVDGSLTQADALLSAGATTMTRADGVLAHVDALLVTNAQPLAEALGGVGKITQRLESILNALDGGQGVLGQLLTNRDLAQDLHHITVDVEAAARLIAEKPSRLVFSDSASDQAQERYRRDSEKMRRNLGEGFGQPVTPVSAPSPGK